MNRWPWIPGGSGRRRRWLRGDRAGSARRWRRVALPAVLLPLVAALAIVAGTESATALTINGDDAVAEPLLLIHGFNDDCEAAFDTAAPGGTSASAYLHDFMALDRVGYYTSDAVHTHATDGVVDDDGKLRYCNANLNLMVNDSSHIPMRACNNLAGDPSAYGTKDDRLERLSCLLAWYIYLTYTHPTSGQPRAVNVLAHSMGGLLIRAAIGLTSAHRANFPPEPLRVLRVVTVATPHGGVGGLYREFALNDNDVNGQELDDMRPGSDFMNTIFDLQKPQGAGGTVWTLMGAANYPAVPPLTAGCTSVVDLFDAGDAASCYLGVSDGVVPTDSQLYMRADYKILYGVLQPGWGDASADPTTKYEHEVGIDCIPLVSVGIDVSACFSGPYYLNDGSSALTRAWVCSSACGNTGLPGGVPVPAKRSLATIVDRLKAPVIADVPLGGEFATRWRAIGGVGNSLPIGYWYPTSGGQRQDFMRGDGPLSIFWHSGSGTYEVHGAIFRKYLDLGGPAGFGFPRSNESTTPDGVGRYNHFDGNRSIYWYPGIGAHEVHGDIWAKWTALGRERSVLGYPVTDETAIAGGRVSYFANQTCHKPVGPNGSGGAIYWTSATGAHEVHGCILDRYVALGGPGGSGLGFPISDEYASSGGPRSDFQCGYILWHDGIADAHIACGGYSYYAPTVTAMQRNTANCPGYDQWWTATDWSGVPIDWTYAMTNTCMRAEWRPTTIGDSCHFDFYVPNGYADAKVRFDILVLHPYPDDFPEHHTVVLDESTVIGWQQIYSGNDVVAISFVDDQDQSYPTMIGWGSAAAHSLRQHC